ncbi:MAG: PaaI family thioesterase [Promethearchaeota archaeon]|jgi:uncharacterized protein (TIGR00369 family)
MQEIKTPFKVKGDLEFDIVEITQEYVISKMPIKPGMLNPFGTVHAGAMLWLADVTATALLFQNTIKEKSFPVAVNLYTNLLSALREGEITTKSQIVRSGKRITVVRTILTGNDNQLLVEVTTTHIKSKFQS